MISLTEGMFDDIRQNSKDIWLVDFFAPWCHPCMLSLNELSNLPHQLEGKSLKVGIVDCEIHKQLCFDQGVNR
jgi:DnaJ family protein C protein 10